jgi:NAD(P)-dependent dehydrogenase (short-subunit alcohol dehydrogenase family)
MRLAGKHALVTGAQQGIGRATVLALAREGADVAINWLDDKAAAERLAGEVKAAGRKAFTTQGDVSKSKEVDRMVADADAALGGLDVLVNNAGVFPRSPFLDLSESEWDQVLDINLKGSFLCAQAVARRMVADGRRGAIVNISSSSVRGNALGVHYGAGPCRQRNPGQCGCPGDYRYGTTALPVFGKRNAGAIAAGAVGQHGAT